MKWYTWKICSIEYTRTQCSVGTDAVIRQRNVGITEEELKKDECRGDAISS